MYITDELKKWQKPYHIEKQVDFDFQEVIFLVEFAILALQLSSLLGHILITVVAIFLGKIKETIIVRILLSKTKQHNNFKISIVAL